MICIPAWQLLTATVLIVVITFAYGELKARPIRARPAPRDETRRHRNGETVESLRHRHGADDLPRYP